MGIPKEGNGWMGGRMAIGWGTAEEGLKEGLNRPQSGMEYYVRTYGSFKTVLCFFLFVLLNLPGRLSLR